MINKDFFAALELLETEKGISEADFISALENALAIAYKKYTGDPSKVFVKLVPEKTTIKFYSKKLIVEEVMDPESEISLDEAVEIKRVINLATKFWLNSNPKTLAELQHKLHVKF